MTPTTPPQKKNPLLKKMFSGITDQQSLFNLGVQQERHRIEEIIKKLQKDWCETAREKYEETAYSVLDKLKSAIKGGD